MISTIVFFVVSHNLTVSSQDAEAISFLLGGNIADVTMSVWPSSICIKELHISATLGSIVTQAYRYFLSILLESG